MKFLSDIFERMIAWLFSSSQTKVRAGRKGELYDIDTDELCRRLNIDEEAKKLGDAGLPLETETIPTAIEHRVMQEIQVARSDFVEWASGRLQLFNSEIARADLTERTNRIRSAASELEQRASAKIAEFESMLRSLAETANGAQREYDNFRSRHQLTRQPDFPDTSGYFLRVCVLLLLIGVEAAANSWFFAQGSWNGLLGGFIYAAIFAAINVFVAWFLSNLVRYVFHTSLIPKLFGIASMGVASAVALGIGLLIAHYRVALQTSTEGQEPAAIAVTSLMADPFALGDVNSILLLVVSLVFAFIALIDGISMSDKFPGYARVFKKHDAARQEYEEELSALREALEDLKEEVLTDVEHNLEKARTQLRDLNDKILAKTETQQRMLGALSNAIHCRDTLIHRFRNENSIHRKTPPPRYFQEQMPIPALSLPGFDTAADRAKYEAQASLLEEVTAQLETIRSDVQAAFTKQFDSLVPLTHHMQKNA